MSTVPSGRELTPVRARGSAVWILMYHGITASAKISGVTNNERYNIHRDYFDQHLAYLSTHCNPIGLTEMRMGRRLDTNKPNVILSFDDGYENNYTVAFPLLTRYRIPAVFALPTAFVCNREPLWNDVVEYAVNNSPLEHIGIKWAHVMREFTITDLADRLALYEWLMGECVRVQQERRSDFIDVVVDALGVAAYRRELFQHADYRPLTMEQISQMAESGLIEYASHSVHHYLLTRLRVSTRQRELQDSKDQIETLTNRPCTTFSVPAGFYNRNVLRDVLSTGYEVVLTSGRGTAVPGKQVLPRNVLLDGDNVRVLADLLNGCMDDSPMS